MKNETIQQKDMDEIPNYIKIHILKLNIAFAERNRSYPKYPETYGNICIMNKDNTYTIYGELPITINYEKSLYIQLGMKCNCFIDDNGLVIKNRWGDDDCIGR